MLQYLRPVYPGQLHTIRLNAWNLVFVLDLALAPSLETIYGSISTMIQRGLPIRFGLVPMFTPGQNDMCRCLYRLCSHHSTHNGSGILLCCAGLRPGRDP